MNAQTVAVVDAFYSLRYITFTIFRSIAFAGAIGKRNSLVKLYLPQLYREHN